LISARALAGGLPANFWRLWGSSTAANLADGVVWVALPLIAVRLTTSPIEVATVTVWFQIPRIGLALLAGGLADRLDRRWTMVAVQSVRVVVIGSLAAAAALDGLGLGALYAAAFLLGAGEAFFDSNAQSIVPVIVPRQRLMAANGRLVAAEVVMNTFVGPPLGGLLVAMAVPVALASATLGFALAAGGLVMIAGSFRPQPHGQRRRLALEIGEGISHLGRHPVLLTTSAMISLGRLGLDGVFAVLALYAVAPGPMGLSEPGYGLLLLPFGVGSALASVAVGRVAAIIGRSRLLALSSLVFAAGLSGPAITTEVVPVAIGFFFAGAATITLSVTSVSLRQALAPNALMGRVQATHRFATSVAGLGGAVIAAVVGEWLGLRAAMAVCSGVAALAVLGGAVITEDTLKRAEAARNEATAAIADAPRDPYATQQPIEALPER
jgi:MFS family permease